MQAGHKNRNKNLIKGASKNTQETKNRTIKMNKGQMLLNEQTKRIESEQKDKASLRQFTNTEID